MEALSLLSPKAGPSRLPQAPTSELDLYVRWESILGKDDLEEVEWRRKHFWPGSEIVNVEHQWHLIPNWENSALTSTPRFQITDLDYQHSASPFQRQSQLSTFLSLIPLCLLSLFFIPLQTFRVWSTSCNSRHLISV
jgi:hypothetical protein